MLAGSSPPSQPFSNLENVVASRRMSCTQELRHDLCGPNRVSQVPWQPNFTARMKPARFRVLDPYVYSDSPNGVYGEVRVVGSLFGSRVFDIGDFTGYKGDHG